MISNQKKNELEVKVNIKASKQLSVFQTEGKQQVMVDAINNLHLLLLINPNLNLTFYGT